MFIEGFVHGYKHGEQAIRRNTSKDPEIGME